MKKTPGRKPLAIPEKANKLLWSLTVRDASKALGVCTVTIRKWRKDLRIPGSWVVSEKQLKSMKTAIMMAEAVILHQSLEKAAQQLNTSRQLVHKKARAYLKRVWAWR